MRDPTSRRRWVAFATISLLSVALAAAWIVRERRAGEQPGALPENARERASSIARQPHVAFRDLGPPPAFGNVALAPLDDPRRDRVATDVPCVRLHFASGTGLCLETPTADPRKTTVHVLGPRFVKRRTFSIEGIPSRARVSPDGRRGAITVFVTGHSYAEIGMSTQTLLLDLEHDRTLGDLEAFALFRDGVRYEAEDLNYWGVTFTRDSNRFYATAASGSNRWLVSGDVEAKRLEVLRDDVECPSLSPDGRRIAFKRAMSTEGAWRLHVLDLASGAVRLLAGETRFIDDQAEWLDDGHVLYRFGQHVYVLAVDGDEPPRVFLEQAGSPAVVRTP